MKLADLYATLNEREQKELDFAVVYAARFAHGTDGHNRLMLLAKIVDWILANEVKDE